MEDVTYKEFKSKIKNGSILRKEQLIYAYFVDTTRALMLGGDVMWALTISLVAVLVMHLVLLLLAVRAYLRRVR